MIIGRYCPRVFASQDVMCPEGKRIRDYSGKQLLSWRLLEVRRWKCLSFGGSMRNQGLGKTGGGRKTRGNKRGLTVNFIKLYSRRRNCKVMKLIYHHNEPR